MKTWGEYREMVKVALSADRAINFDQGGRLREPLPVPVDPRALRYLLAYLPDDGKVPTDDTFTVVDSAPDAATLDAGEARPVVGSGSPGKSYEGASAASGDASPADTLRSMNCRAEYHDDCPEAGKVGSTVCRCACHDVTPDADSVLFCTVCEGDDHTAARKRQGGVTVTFCPRQIGDVKLNEPGWKGDVTEEPATQYDPRGDYLLESAQKLGVIPATDDVNPDADPLREATHIIHAALGYAPWSGGRARALAEQLEEVFRSGHSAPSDKATCMSCGEVWTVGNLHRCEDEA